MRRPDERGVAVFLAAVVLAVTGTGIAAGRLAETATTDLTVAGAVPPSAETLAAVDIPRAAPSPAPPNAPTPARPRSAVPVIPDTSASEAAASEDPGAPAGTTDGSDGGDDAPAQEPAAAEDAGAEEVAPAPAAVPVLPGRTADSLLPALDLEAVDATAARTGIPARALAAYASTGLRIADEQPGCDLTWVTLAAIGWVESHHATIGGRSLQREGRPDRAIVGVPLDGGPGVRAIRDSDGGRWDGDATWDRAVGPMQFIPSTWRRWQVDASGSGTADPQHIDDASLAAARYLCAAGNGSLAGPQAWYRAVFAYNNSDDYVRTVLDTANRYAELANG